MKMVIKRQLVCGGVALMLVACATVKTVPGAEDVRLLSAAELVNCQRLGSASAQVMDKITFVERDKEKMAKELLKLAQNEAVKMGGNALQIASDIKNGSRQFDVYRC
ncbi:DUF4156 domain-containing protein [Lacimicrobium alkaliphilum]|uniref:DUF4156 domain-containing protein n=1 Tax=Lacimicrobium alkaliphilum TaxID=1526571 RepID=A0A0U2ZFP2_9ALTE|nr:DUF4156 domain-containing protein [Lacimicrobium alkaliphilum]ALS97911.1 hypothetical protein AT746_06275 [Lacimicrobium alkaliphilum]